MECCETQSPENTVNCGAEGPPCGIVPAAPGAVPPSGPSRLFRKLPYP